MTAIVHVFDDCAGWEQRVGSCQLLDRLPRDRFTQHFASIDAGARRTLGAAGVQLELVPRIGRFNLLAAPLLRTLFQRHGADLVHAWGPFAATCATSASQRPLVVSLFDPGSAKQSAKLLRAISHTSGFAIVCATQWIRRRLIERGVPPEACVVIRPGVDFSAIQKTRKSSLRCDLGVPTDAFAVLCPEPGGTDDETLAVFWSCSLLDRLDGRYAVIIPGSGRAVDRIARFAATLPSAAILIAPGDNARFEELVAIADVLVVPNTGDISTTSISWAMAAGVPVIAAAGYAVTELVVARVNGLLYKHPERKSPASKIIPLLRDRDAQRKTAEAARGQAYEVFSLRRYIEQHMQVYENVLSGAPVSQGINDPAEVA